jgi:hypothetical protein
MNGQALAGAAVTFQSNNQVTNPYDAKNAELSLVPSLLDLENPELSLLLLIAKGLV